jgi:hypothetical protein
MAIVLDATPAGSSSNSFATVEQANAYFSGHLYGEFWDDLEPDTKNRALITATRLIIRAFQRVGWQGWLTNTVQSLPLPRVGMYDAERNLIISTVIPVPLVEATAEYAGRLAQAGRMPDDPSDTEGIKSVKAGSVSIDYFESGPSSPTDLPDAVHAMISFLSAQPSMGRTSVPLVRS